LLIAGDKTGQWHTWYERAVQQAEKLYAIYLKERAKEEEEAQAGLAELMGVTPGRVSQIEHGEVSTVEALASYIAALGGKLELIADIGGHLLKMPANPAA
jgi:transcriptional regulator with XRE-family HTH domain